MHLITLSSFRFCENKREILDRRKRNKYRGNFLPWDQFIWSNNIAIHVHCSFFFYDVYTFLFVYMYMYGVAITSFWSRCEFFNNSFKNFIRLHHKNNRASLMFASSIVLPDWLSMALLCKHWIWQDFKISSLDMKQYPSSVI